MAKKRRAASTLNDPAAAVPSLNDEEATSSANDEAATSSAEDQAVTAVKYFFQRCPALQATFVADALAHMALHDRFDPAINYELITTSPFLVWEQWPLLSEEVDFASAVYAAHLDMQEPHRPPKLLDFDLAIQLQRCDTVAAKRLAKAMFRVVLLEQPNVTLPITVGQWMTSEAARVMLAVNQWRPMLQLDLEQTDFKLKGQVISRAIILGGEEAFGILRAQDQDFRGLQWHARTEDERRDLATGPAATWLPLSWRAEEMLDALGLNEDLTCPICLDRLTKPRGCVNGHLFCEECLTEIRGSLLCPTCRVQIIGNNRNLVVERLLERGPKECGCGYINIRDSGNDRADDHLNHFWYDCEKYYRSENDASLDCEICGDFAPCLPEHLTTSHRDLCVGAFQVNDIALPTSSVWEEADLNDHIIVGSAAPVRVERVRSRRNNHGDVTCCVGLEVIRLLEPTSVKLTASIGNSYAEIRLTVGYRPCEAFLWLGGEDQWGPGTRMCLTATAL